MRRHTLGGLVLAVIVLILDQASKQAMLTAIDLPDRGVVPLLPGFLDLTMVWNQGVTFGLLRHAGAVGPVLLACVAIGIVAILLLWLRRAETAMTAWAIGAIAGGALGNVIDRFRFGKVVDFIHVHWAAWDPFPFVFNVGDSAIVLGVATLLLEGVVSRRKV